MTSQTELPRRNLIEHYRGIKGTLIFIISIYLMITLILLSTISDKTDIIDFSLVIIGWTLLISWILYWGYAEHQRVITSLEKSEVLNFLNGQGFQIKEEKTSWNYELNIQVHIEDCLIIVAISKRQGNIWNKYYLNLLGLRDDQLNLAETKYSDKIRIKEYKESIRLTPSTDTKLKLDESLNHFIKELKGQ
jgi:hypothetical protein